MIPLDTQNALLIPAYTCTKYISYMQHSVDKKNWLVVNLDCFPMSIYWVRLQIVITLSYSIQKNNDIILWYFLQQRLCPL